MTQPLEKKAEKPKLKGQANMPGWRRSIRIDAQAEGVLQLLDGTEPPVRRPTRPTKNWKVDQLRQYAVSRGIGIKVAVKDEKGNDTSAKHASS